MLDLFSLVRNPQHSGEPVMSFEIAKLQKQVTELQAHCDELAACVRVQADNANGLLMAITRLQDGQDLLLRCIKSLEEAR
jgi:hypothetical protein